MSKPCMINRGQNFVIISWRSVESLEGECVVEMLDEMKNWRVVYWGEKKQVKVEGLAPCTCYDFRIKKVDDEEWIGLKGATSEGMFLIMHMTRAVKVGKMSLVRKITHSRPVLLEVENKEMKVPLIQAIEKNDLQLVNLLITLGANINAGAYYNKRTPLMVAVTAGHLPIASLLVDKGSNVAATDINGLNILHFAVDSNNLESVKFALKHTSCIDCQDSSGWTPLLRAAILNCTDAIINFLLENGASKTITDKNGFNFEKHRALALKLV